MDQIPNWLGGPLIAAVIAALGYVAKLAIDVVSRWFSIRRERQAKLVALQSLLLVSQRIFKIQNVLVQRLTREIETAHPELAGPYDEVLAHGYPLMNEQQKLDHGLIRAYTVNAMHPLNLAMIDWLEKDTYFKGHVVRGSAD